MDSSSDCLNAHTTNVLAPWFTGTALKMTAAGNGKGLKKLLPGHRAQHNKFFTSVIIIEIK